MRDKFGRLQIIDEAEINAKAVPHWDKSNAALLNICQIGKLLKAALEF